MNASTSCMSLNLVKKSPATSRHARADFSYLDHKFRNQHTREALCSGSDPPAPAVTSFEGIGGRTQTGVGGWASAEGAVRTGSKAYSVFTVETRPLPNSPLRAYSLPTLTRLVSPKNEVLASISSLFCGRNERVTLTPNLLPRSVVPSPRLLSRHSLRFALK